MRSPSGPMAAMRSRIQSAPDAAAISVIRPFVILNRASRTFPPDWLIVGATMVPDTVSGSGTNWNMPTGSSS